MIAELQYRVVHAIILEETLCSRVEIDIEEMRTTLGNKKLPETLFHFPLTGKICLIDLIAYHWHSCVLNYCEIKIFKKVCKVILFWCHEVSKRRIANGSESDKSYFANKGNSETRFGVPLYYFQ